MAIPEQGVPHDELFEELRTIAKGDVDKVDRNLFFSELPRKPSSLIPTIQLQENMKPLLPKLTTFLSASTG